MGKSIVLRKTSLIVLALISATPACGDPEPVFHVDQGGDGDGDGDGQGGSAGGDEGRCGDKTLDPGEACDDGNTLDNDFCSADCSEMHFACTSDGDGQSNSSFSSLNPMSDIQAFCGYWVVVGDTVNHEIAIVNALTGDAQRHYELPGTPGHMAVDRGAGIVYVTLEGATSIAKVDLTSGDVVEIPVGDFAEDVALGPDGLVFASAGTVAVIDGAAEKLLFTQKDIIADDLLAYDSQAATLFVAHYGGGRASITGMVYDGRLMRFNQGSVWWGDRYGRSMVTSEVGGHLLCAVDEDDLSQAYTAIDFSTVDLAPLGAFDVGSYPHASDFTRDGSRVYATNGYEISVFEREHHLELDSVRFETDPQCDFQDTDLAVSGGGTLAFLAGNCSNEDRGGEIVWWRIPALE